MKQKTQPTHTQPTTEGAGVQPPADKTDTTLDELRAENERLKRQLKERDAHDSLKDKLKQAGARTPKLLLEAAKHGLQFTAAGELENLAGIVDSLKDKFPEQFGHEKPAVPSIDAGAGRTHKPQLTREALAKMKPSEIAELDWNDVRRVLSSK
ncbi:MAG TPA: hypothetical protein VGO43_09280 [Pyrinomonadaceae bacterium]|jgi:hypothetical protein|nr:hypothetical protein [Pyrinomonadaceae bacterium]